MNLQTSLVRGLGVVAGLLLLAIPAAAADGPLKLTRFHATAKMTVTQPGQTPTTFPAEWWVRDELTKTRVEDPSTGQVSFMIQRDKLLYLWVDQAQTGTKIPPESELGMNSINFRDISRCLRRIENSSPEMVDGVATRRYDVKKCGLGDTSFTAWIAEDGSWLKKLDLRWNNSQSITVFGEVEEIALPEDAFLPPERMPFITPPELVPEAAGEPTSRPPAPGGVS